ncbi:nucleotidyl transferase AbiEii/AbiGii toxin family protein [Alishewanella longhuensis]
MLRTTETDGYQLVFAGRIYLAKVYKHTHRMSEDIDLKLVPDAATKLLSKFCAAYTEKTHPPQYRG